MANLNKTVLALRNEMCLFLGYASDITDWAVETRLTDAEKQTVLSIISAGFRKAYYNGRHRWSFLRPTIELVVWPSSSDRTIASTTATTITLDSATFYPTMVGASIVVGSNSYVITAVTDDGTQQTTATVATDPSGESDGASVTITSEGWALLPATFGGLLGPIWFDEGSGRLPALDLTTLHEIKRRKQGDLTTGQPRMAALRPLADYSGTTGQRFKLEVWPIPDLYYTTVFRCEIRPEEQAEGDYLYGGPEFAEVLTENCLAVAEQRMNDEAGFHTALAEQTLFAAIEHDKKLAAPEVIRGGRRCGATPRATVHDGGFSY